MIKKILFTILIILCNCSLSKGQNITEPIDTLSSMLGEVVVTGQSARQRIETTTPGVEKIEISKMASLPLIFGENDIIKSISLLPGVNSESEGAGGFEVRGGNASQNLILLDGMTLYNPSHVMGIFSTFNAEALGAATLYKGPIPANFGGATSSALDCSLSRGDMKKYHGSFTLGLLLAKIKAEGPIVKDKLSFSLTARRSYADLFLKMVPQYRSTVMNFYDITAKLSYIPRHGDNLDLSFFASRDNMAIKNVMGMYWGNLAASLNWLTKRGDRWRLKTAGAFTSFTPDMTMSMMKTDMSSKEYIRNFSISQSADYLISENQNLSFGLESKLLKVKSGEMHYNGVRMIEVRSGWENALWVNYDANFFSKLNLAAGVRFSTFTALSGQKFHEFLSVLGSSPDFSSKTYISPQPRLSLSYHLASFHTLKAGMSFATQNIHAIRATETSMPFDRYALSSVNVRPENSRQYVVAYNGMTPSGAFDWSVEIYYKDMQNVYDYRDGRDMMSDINLESIILGGKGRSYGVEFMIRKNNGPLTGWIAYTYSKTQSKIDGINDGKWYDASNDRRHNISATASYHFNNKWEVSGIWSFASGQPLTLPDVKFELSGITCYYFSGRNTYKTPPSHHLDLSATYTHVGKKMTYQWSFGVYNLYNRYNPFVIYFTDDSSKPSGTKAVQQSLYGILPFVSYTLKF